MVFSQTHGGTFEEASRRFGRGEFYFAVFTFFAFWEVKLLKTQVRIPNKVELFCPGRQHADLDVVNNSTCSILLHGHILLIFSEEMKRDGLQD